MQRFLLKNLVVSARSKEECIRFKARYEDASKLILPVAYMEKSDVYVFKRKDQIIGGFILGKDRTLRTLEVFSSPSQRKALYHFFKKGDECCEICCFWLDRRFRKRPLLNAWVWLRMARIVRDEKTSFVLFGTNVEGLAKLYHYPQKSLLFHRDRVDRKDTFIFLARREDFVLGVWEIVKSKFFNRNGREPFAPKYDLRKALLHDLSK